MSTDEIDVQRYMTVQIRKDQIMACLMSGVRLEAGLALFTMIGHRTIRGRAGAIYIYDLSTIKGRAGAWVGVRAWVESV